MLQNEKYIIKNLDWDTDFFKVKSARIYLQQELSFKDVEDIKKYIMENEYKFVTIENTNNNDSNNMMIQNFDNVFLVDVNIQYSKQLAYNENTIPNSCIQIKNNLEENQQIIHIAQNAFTYSRFKNDKNLNVQKDKVYVEWTKNSFNKSDKYFCYFVNENKVLGYILFSIDKNREFIFLELIAVDNKVTRKGIGQQLILELEKFALLNGVNSINVGTQLNNLQAQNFYEKNGFKHKSNHSIYHWWL